MQWIFDGIEKLMYEVNKNKGYSKEFVNGYKIALIDFHMIAQEEYDKVTQRLKEKLHDTPKN